MSLKCLGIKIDLLIADIWTISVENRHAQSTVNETKKRVKMFTDEQKV